LTKHWLATYNDRSISIVKTAEIVIPTSGAAADFSLITYEGTDFRLSEQRGKVVIINFWGSWCGPCQSEAPVLQNIWEMYQDRGVEVFGVAYVNIDKNAVAFIEEFGLTYPNGPNIELKISDAYRIQGVPETLTRMTMLKDIRVDLWGANPIPSPTVNHVTLMSEPISPLSLPSIVWNWITTMSPYQPLPLR
jgi:thiol-disulfide isomerase/thioredoxin